MWKNHPPWGGCSDAFHKPCRFRTRKPPRPNASPHSSLFADKNTDINGQAAQACLNTLNRPDPNGKIRRVLPPTAKLLDEPITAEGQRAGALPDFDSWLKDCGVKRHLAGITYDNVFRYKYDPSSWAHGCVKATYKDRLSRQRSKDGLDCDVRVGTTTPGQGE